MKRRARGAAVARDAPAPRASPTGSSCCTTSRRSASPPAASSASRRWCAGTIRSAGSSHPSAFIPLAEETPADPAARRVGAAHRLQADARVAATAGSTCPRDVGEPLRAAVPAARPRRDACAACSTRPASTPSALELEITETTAMQNAETTVEVLHALRELGVAHLHRRLRHRLLVAQLPEALPDHRREDRPRLRPRPGHATTATPPSSPPSSAWPAASTCA